MKHKKKTFLFIHKFMGIGGIQTYLIRTLKQLKRNGHRIIWVFPEGGYIDKSFEKELLDGSIEIIKVNLNHISWIKRLDIRFEKDEEICALAFNLFNFIFLEMIKKKYNKIRIDSFFWVPHFEGKSIFIEEFAPSILQPIFRKYIGNMIYNMEKNNNIIYVNESHLNAFIKTYKYKVENKIEKILIGDPREIPVYNLELAKKRSERENFNIISIGRFSFPHKAYILGLIQVYGEMKEKYNNLNLTIIGYGPDENLVLSEINNLSFKAKKDINYVGKVAYEDLKKYFEHAHLNIGVAGTIVDGAVSGLISIPVRHYSKICEGYGYLPYSREYITSSEPGKPIEIYIEEIINMEKIKYLELSRRSYDTYAEEINGNENEILLSKRNKNPHMTVRNRYVIALRIGFILAKLLK